MTVEKTENNTGKEFDELICEACGENFSCGARAGQCWCFAVELEMKTLAKLRADFQGCLCGNCLSSAQIEDDSEQAG